MSAAIRTAVVTGGNTGIGFETAKALCEKGYRAVIGCRDMDKAAAAVAKIKTAVPQAELDASYIDLADLKTVRTFATKIVDAGEPVDVLINNAGVMACPQMLTADGFEYQLGVNHLSHFLLTSTILPLLSDPGRASRIVNVSSSAHETGIMAFDDLMSEKNYNPWKAYCQSKLANVLFTYELSRRIPSSYNLTANCLHPGVVATELARYMLPEDAWYRLPITVLVGLFLKTPEQGAMTSVFLATSNETDGVSGKYYADSKPKPSSNASYNQQDAEKLWDVSCKLTDCKWPI